MGLGLGLRRKGWQPLASPLPTQAQSQSLVLVLVQSLQAQAEGLGRAAGWARALA